MASKCSITHEYCKAADFIYRGDCCPIRKYKSSSTKAGADAPALIDDTCRYYGLKRAAEIEHSNFMEA